MFNLVDVELKQVKTADGRLVPGACGTCRRCGRTAEVTRFQEQGMRPVAAGYEKLPEMIRRACDAVATGCQETKGPNRVQSFPHTYFVAIISKRVRLYAEVFGKTREFFLFDKDLFTELGSGPLPKSTPVSVCYLNLDEKEAIQAVNHLSKLKYNANRLEVEDLEAVPDIARTPVPAF